MSWIERSNENARPLLEVMARFSPESAGQLGVAGVDGSVIDLDVDHVARERCALEEALAELRARLAHEHDVFLRQDLEILIDAASLQLEGMAIFEAYELPTLDVAQTVFHGVHALLDPQVEAQRRPAALQRLERYAGLLSATPTAQLAEARLRERLAIPGLVGPVRAQVDKVLANGAAYLDGVASLLASFGLRDERGALAAIRGQVGSYHEFLRAEILPRARGEFRLPPAIYAFRLRQMGVDFPLEELRSRARVAFREIQHELAALAPIVAREQGFASGDYRAVLGELKKRQLEGEDIRKHYEQRIGEVEALIRTADLVTLPARPMRMRLASEAESAATPAPHMKPPRLIGNTGEMGEFVLPLRAVGAGAGAALAYDDFSFEAASWTLLAHEGRPGHELQFAALVEGGVSVARALFAFNSVNVEGWALYAEAEMKPLEPLDGQLVALQYRLLRAARAILDPALHDGSVSVEEAARVLREDVVVSEAMIAQELDRYTFWAPGQATSYFCGYQRWMELRVEVERALGTRFDRRRFHDFVLAEGLLPPRLLSRAVMERFVPGER